MRLEITGFMSFAKRTVLDFEGGITAFVCPNVSGKSTIADAIRCVMESKPGRSRAQDRLT